MTCSLRLRRLVAGHAVGLSLLIIMAPLGGASISVNTPSDLLQDTGSCSLREAVIAANSNAPSGAMPGECPSGSSGSTDTILLPAGDLLLSLAGSESTTAVLPEVGDLDVTQSLIIIGQGAGSTSIDATGLGARAIHVDGATVSFSILGLKITGGTTTGSGGGIYFEDGVALTVSHVDIVSNSSQGSGGGVFATNTGGAVFRRVRFVDNDAGDHGGGLAWSDCSGCGQNLVVDACHFDSNRTTGTTFSNGGGARLDRGSILLRRSVFESNHSDEDGGALIISGDLTAKDLTISGNDADGDGGGIYFDFSPSALLENCTISGNSALGEGGGVASTSNDVSLLSHCTISSNTSPTGSAIATADEFAARNSIISGICAGGIVDSFGGNIESPGDNCGLDQASDQVAVSAASLQLGALSSNGGNFRTHLLGPASAALNAGLPAFCPESDQRGFPRPASGSCDSGAVEGSTLFIFIDGFELGDVYSWSSSSPLAP